MCYIVVARMMLWCCYVHVWFSGSKMHGVTGFVLRELSQALHFDLFTSFLCCHLLVPRRDYDTSKSACLSKLTNEGNVSEDGKDQIRDPRTADKFYSTNPKASYIVLC